MVSKLVKMIVGSRNDRLVKQKRKEAKQVNLLEESFSTLSDDELKAKTAEFKGRFEQGETLEQLMPEAFSAVREAATRVLKMRHFDVQLIGGMILNDGKIAEMRTGEGKTLVATLAAYLNALPGKGVHVITVNDYLASRDAEWMGKIYSFLGMTTGVIVGGLDSAARREAYSADITYGTNNEFGFDYLRDNMAFSLEEKVQRDLYFAIIDEVDSILIDEARTPLIISGPTDDKTDLYLKIDGLIPQLNRQEGEEGEEGDFYVDEKARQVYLTELGHESVEAMMVKNGLLGEDDSLYSSSNIRLMHHVTAALRAHALFQRNVDYIVQDGEIVIVDEFTGRTMPGRRWSDGLHQAVEAKEAVKIQNENQTLASITFQNYFRLYGRLSGMTGTADTEAYELQQIYGLEVVVIPTHREMTRDDMGDLVYLSKVEKHQAIVVDIKDCIKRGQPVLVGTASVESSEEIAVLLEKDNVPHEVLNAKQHEREAHIIAQAGRAGSVTIATNMAGRGTDIVLGGNLEVELEDVDAENESAVASIKAAWDERHAAVLAAGGLHVIGTERHESRRVDNQLRGRSGRQGDAGSTRFYLSLEDDLMRIFASERVANLMQKLGMEEGEAIEHPWVTRAIENAQRKVEGRNFDIRKQLLEYDNVANDQRKVIYGQRNELMATEDVSEMIRVIREDVVNQVLDQHIPQQSMEGQWDLEGLEIVLESEFGMELTVQTLLDEDDSLHEESLRALIQEKIGADYLAKEEQVGSEVVRHFEKAVMLQVLDNTWKDHLGAMDSLRQGIHLRGYAQKDPKQEFKREAFEMFSNMLDSIKQEVITILSKVKVNTEEDVEAVEAQRERQVSSDVHYEHAASSALADEAPQPEEPKKVQEQPYARAAEKVGRNDPCPCGSGKKYKQCHGKLK